MKIQFEEQQIRLRLRASEFSSLQNGGSFSVEFGYLPLSVVLCHAAVRQHGRLAEGRLEIALSELEIAALAAPATQKEGIQVWVQVADGPEIAVGIQFDLNSKVKEWQNHVE